MCRADPCRPVIPSTSAATGCSAGSARAGWAGCARNEYLAGTARYSLLDSVLPDYTIQRPTPEAMAGFAQVITEFTMARASFLEGQQVVAASDPLTDEAYSTGVDRFADGTRNLALAGTVTEGIPALPPEYSAAGLADPACDE